MKAILIAALLMLPSIAGAEMVDQIAARYKLAGEVLVAKGDTVLLDKAYGTGRPGGGKAQGGRAMAAGVDHQASHGGGDCWETRDDRTEGRRSDSSAQGNLAGLTMRQLLQHHSGLANPDDTKPASTGVPAFYTRRRPDLDYCVSKPAKPGATFSYNNCDYWVAAGVVGFDLEPPSGMTYALAGETGVRGFVGGKPEPTFELASYGPAGGLLGTARALLKFDRSLMTGKLLPLDQLAELWKPEGHGSYQALGQWVFPVALKGCAKRKRIVQRDGEIGGVQTRNYILPDDDLVVVVFTNRSSDDFAIGEIWQGKGFSHDLLSAVACP